MNAQPAGAPAGLDRAGNLPHAAVPLGPPALGLAFGVALDEHLELPPWVTAALLIGVGVALLMPSVRTRAATALTFAAGAIAGATLHDRLVRRASPHHLVHRVSDESQLLRISGTVVAPPRQSLRPTGFFAQWIHQPDSTRFTLSASRVELPDGPAAAVGLIDVTVKGACPNVNYGSRVGLLGMARRTPSASNPGQFDFARWLRRQGIFITLHCKNPDALVLESADDNGWRGALASIRSAARGLLLGPDLDHQPERDGFLETLVLGWRYSISDRIEQQFRRTGTTHILAVSGAHVGVIAWFAWAVTRGFGVSRRASAVTVLAATILYGCVVDPRPPVLRAVLIALVLCVGMILRRRTNPLNSLALAACILILLRPTVVFEPGCQMSFAGVAAMFCLGPTITGAFQWPLRRRLSINSVSPIPGPRSRRHRILRSACLRFTHVAAIGTAATLACAPLIAFHFGRVAPLAPLNTLLLAPFFTLTLVLSVLAMIVGLALPVLAPAVRILADASAAAMLTAADIVDRINPPAPPKWNDIAAVIYALLLLIAIAATPFRGRSAWSYVNRGFECARRTGARRMAAFLLSVVGAALVARAVARDASRDSSATQLRVTLLEVGRGTASVIQFPNGSVWLYDCGTNRSSDVADRVILPFCRHAGITRIDRIFLSHPNLDHYSGLFTLLNGIDCGPVVVNEHFHRFADAGGPADALLAELRRRRHPLDVHSSSPATFPTDPAAKVHILWPPAVLPPRADANDSSTVLRLSHGGKSVLLCGDIGHDAMAAMIHTGRLGADMVVLPHHGAWQTNTAEFLNAVAPRVCVQSSDRTFHRSSRRFREALAGRPLLNTADEGAVRLVLAPSEWTASGFRDRTMTGASPD